MQDNSNNQNPPASSVEEYEPERRERVADTCNQVGKLAVVAILAGATSALSFGICAGVTRDALQCLIPAGLIAGMTACSSALFMYFFASFRSQLSLINQVARLDSEIAVGIPVFSGLPTAPELNSASGVPLSSPSFQRERGHSQISSSNHTSATVVFSNQINP
jgi:hypothetical protein